MTDARLGVLSRVATRTLRAYVQAALGALDSVPGLVVCVQTFGAVAHFHPHLQVLMSDGVYRRDGTFVLLPEPDAAVLEAPWQRSVLAVRAPGLARVGRGGGDARLAALV